MKKLRTTPPVLLDSDDPTDTVQWATIPLDTKTALGGSLQDAGTDGRNDGGDQVTLIIGKPPRK